MHGVGVEPFDEIDAAIVDVGPSAGVDVAAGWSPGAKGFAPLGGLQRKRIGREFGKMHRCCRLKMGRTT